MVFEAAWFAVCILLNVLLNRLIINSYHCKPPGLQTALDLVTTDFVNVSSLWAIQKGFSHILISLGLLMPTWQALPWTWTMYFNAVASFTLMSIGIILRYLNVYRNKLVMEDWSDDRVRWTLRSVVAFIGLLCCFLLTGIGGWPRLYEELTNSKVDQIKALALLGVIVSITILINIVLRVLIHLEKAKLDDQTGHLKRATHYGVMVGLVFLLSFGFIAFLTPKMSPAKNMIVAQCLLLLISVIFPTAFILSNKYHRQYSKRVVLESCRRLAALMSRKRNVAATPA